MISPTADNVVEIPPTHWRAEALAAHQRGEWLEWLFGVDAAAGHDDSAALQVIALYRSETSTRMVRTRVTPSAPLESLADVCPSARWYERELAEMFGVTVVGGDPRRLLLHWLPDDVAAPLRRTFPLGKRQTSTWPGAAGARRSKVPGVHPDWQEK